MRGISEPKSRTCTGPPFPAVSLGSCLCSRNGCTSGPSLPLKAGPCTQTTHTHTQVGPFCVSTGMTAAFCIQLGPKFLPELLWFVLLVKPLDIWSIQDPSEEKPLTSPCARNIRRTLLTFRSFCYVLLNRALTRRQLDS